MLIKSNQVYYTVEGHKWLQHSNKIVTVECLDIGRAIAIYKSYKADYERFSKEDKANTMFRLAKVQNGQSVTLASCGYGVVDNFSLETEEGPE
jgi:hypothetical protein